MTIPVYPNAGYKTNIEIYVCTAETHNKLPRLSIESDNKGGGQFMFRVPNALPR